AAERQADLGRPSLHMGCVWGPFMCRRGAGATQPSEEKNMRYGRTLAAITLVAGLGFAATPAVHAQEVPPAEQATVEVTPELLDRFVEVYPDVMAIAQTAQVELSTAETAEDAQAIQLEAQQEIAATLEEADF